MIENLPSKERFGIYSQISRSTISIPSSIAEGCSRSSQKDFNKYIEIALGSSFELETQLILTDRVGFANKNEVVNLVNDLQIIQKKLNALRNKLK